MTKLELKKTYGVYMNLRESFTKLQEEMHGLLLKIEEEEKEEKKKEKEEKKKEEGIRFDKCNYHTAVDWDTYQIIRTFNAGDGNFAILMKKALDAFFDIISKRDLKKLKLNFLKTKPTEESLTLQEIVPYLGSTEYYVRKQIVDGNLPHYWEKGVLHFEKEEIDKWIKKTNYKPEGKN